MTETIIRDRWRFHVTTFALTDLRSVTAEWLDIMPPGIDDYVAARGYVRDMFGREPDLWRVPTPTAVFGAPIEWVDVVPA